MKADLRISMRDHRRKKNPTTLLFRTPSTTRQFFVRMNGERWPKGGGPVSLTRVLAGVRKALGKAF